MNFRPDSGSLTMTDQLHLHTVKNKTYEFWFVEIRFRVTQKFFRRGFIYLVSSKVIELYLPLCNKIGGLENIRL